MPLPVGRPVTAVNEKQPSCSLYGHGTARFSHPRLCRQSRQAGSRRLSPRAGSTSGGHASQPQPCRHAPPAAHGDQQCDADLELRGQHAVPGHLQHHLWLHDEVADQPAEAKDGHHHAQGPGDHRVHDGSKHGPAQRVGQRVGVWVGLCGAGSAVQCRRKKGRKGRAQIECGE